MGDQALSGRKRRFPARAVADGSFSGFLVQQGAGEAEEKLLLPRRLLEVRKAPSRPKSWANLSLL
jgi:hypothetical protein